MQTVRLDQDSLDYDWNGLRSKFHGTLPYENLRLKRRVIRKDRRLGVAALFVGLILLLLVLYAPSPRAWFVQMTATIFAGILGAFVSQLISGGTIGVQIDPRPFGFGGEFAIPDTKVGRAFLVELERCWDESLRRRFLVREVDDAVRLQRIGWLESMGVLTSEEASAERSVVDSQSKPEQRSSGDFALN